MPAKTLKAADKQNIVKKLVTEMKRRYGGSVPKQNRSTFETLLFAICLEDADQASAEAAYARLLEGFFDLNEIRVSSVSEIQAAFGEFEGADWKAMRIREALQHVFEKHFAFDLEFLKRKTQEQAVKELLQIPYQTPFVRNYVVQNVLGAHVLPVDESMNQVLRWLGLADLNGDVEAAGEDLKSAVKKADGAQLCHLLKCVSVDRELTDHFQDLADDEEELNPLTGPQRLAEVFKNPRKKRKPKPAAKAVSRKKPVKKTTGRSAAPKAAPKPAARKVAKKVPKNAKRPRAK
jgi:endonuclease-3